MYNINFAQVLSLCLEELLFDRSVLQEDFTKAQHHLNNITVLDHCSAQYRYIILYIVVQVHMYVCIYLHYTHISESVTYM